MLRQTLRRASKPPRLRPQCFFPRIHHRNYDGPFPRRTPPRFPEHEHDTQLARTNPWTNDIQPLQDAYDPANVVDDRLEGLFDFLKPEYADPEGDIDTLTWNYIHPRDHGVPWPTSFSHSLQSKYWNEVRGSLQEFLRDALESPAQVGRWDKGQVAWVLDAASAFVVNVFPTAGVEKLNVLARVYALWMIRGMSYIIPHLDIAYLTRTENFSLDVSLSSCDICDM